MIENTFTTINFYQIDGAWSRFLAFSLMGISKFKKVKGDGMLVGKLLGTGAGLGFSRNPNWGQYALLGVWEEEKSAKKFFESNFFHRKFTKLSHKQVVLEMEPFQSRGIWDGKNPYPDIPSSAEGQGQVAILTRAKLKFKNIPSFWKHVDPVNESLKNAEGRLFSAGMGEWHFSHPITFSVWENIEQAKDFAYQQRFHAEAIKGARVGGWFKEDLFVRFQVKKFEGQ
jgi:hypothetical protein